MIIFVTVSLLTLAVYLSGNLFCDFFLSNIKFIIKIKYKILKLNINKLIFFTKTNTTNMIKNIL